MNRNVGKGRILKINKLHRKYMNRNVVWLADIIGTEFGRQK